jgi:hypothetical protein
MVIKSGQINYTPVHWDVAPGTTKPSAERRGCSSQIINR